ncbi:MAG: hypothetical protein KF868_20080 [Acidobacteria bacterium]|nr:hypothetical protein [Acidobacteriota bacterium]MCW5971633.1 hypothetical protein [Blastocatellales bacterium]
MKINRRDFASAVLASTGAIAVRGQEPKLSGASPREVVLRGRVVCVTEELQQRYHVAADCDRRGHLYAVKTTDGELFAFLPTDAAAAIYLDERCRERELQVTSRLFPDLGMIEVIRLQSWKQGRLHNLFYFCEVCNIRTHKPGPCDCCQDPVEFREIAVAEDEEER